MAPAMPSPHRKQKRQLQQARELPQVTGAPCRQTARVCEFCLHSRCVETEASAWFWMYQQPAQAGRAMLSCGSCRVTASNPALQQHNAAAHAS